jgi:hypothetical protein
MTPTNPLPPPLPAAPKTLPPLPPPPLAPPPGIAPGPARAASYTELAPVAGPPVNLFYGATSTGKSTQHARIAEWIWKAKPFGPERRRTKLILSDGGGTSAYDHLIVAGIVEVLDLRTAVDASKRFGPESIMEAIFHGKWLPFRQGVDASGKPTGTPVLSDHDWSGTGYLVVESINTLAQLTFAFLSAAGLKVKDDEFSAYTIPSADGDINGEVRMAQGGRSHYMVVQSTVNNWLLQRFAQFDVPMVGISAHESKGQDDMSAGSIYGPAMIGKAATAKIPGAISLLVHFDTVYAPGSGDPEYRAYLRRHPDPENPMQQWPANARLPEFLIADARTKYPQGFIKLEPATLSNPGSGLDTFLAWKLGAVAKYKSSLAE